MSTNTLLYCNHYMGASHPTRGEINSMWNEKKSISLSKLCILMFMGLLVVTVVFAPWLTRWSFNFPRPVLDETQAFFLATVYVGSIPAAYLLYNLLRLLRRIQAGQVFITDNVENLRRISWTCFVGAGIALVSTFYYLPHPQNPYAIWLHHAIHTF